VFCTFSRSIIYALFSQFYVGFWGLCPQTPPGSTPGPRWRTFVSRPPNLPTHEKILQAPMLVSLTTAVQYVEKSILQHTHVSHQYTQRDDGRAHSKIELIIVARPILVAHLSYHIRETFCVIKHDGVSLLLICVNVLRTWVARFKRSSCSLCTTCHTISWFIYLLFAYDVCVWRINLID